MCLLACLHTRDYIIVWEDYQFPKYSQSWGRLRRGWGDRKQGRPQSTKGPWDG